MKKIWQSDQSTAMPIIIIFFFLVIAIFLMGVYYYGRDVTALKINKQNELAAIADLKIRQVGNWLSEREADALTIQNNGAIAQSVKDFLADGSGDEVLRHWLASICNDKGFLSASILDASGAVRLAYGTGGDRIGPNGYRLFNDAFGQREFTVSDLHLSRITGKAEMDLVVPLILWARKDQPLIGVLFLRTDPRKMLYPLIQSWPSPSRSAETILLRREGNEVIYLSELRHRRDTALKLRLPVTQDGLTEAMAARGNDGVIEGKDYRNVPVLAVSKKVPKSPWILISKVDQEEVYSVVRQHRRYFLFFLVLLTTTTGALLGLWWRHQRSVFYRNRYQLEVRRVQTAEKLRESEEKFRSLSEASPMGIFQTDKDGKIVYVNHRWSEISGLSYEHSRGDGWTKALHADDTEGFRRMWEQCREKKQRGSREFRFVRPSGAMRWVNMHMAAMCSSAGDIVGYVSVIEDITERKLIEEEIRLSLQEKETLLQEIHHRVKNNLQIISSMLKLHAEHIGNGEIRKIFRESQNRIRAMAAVHTMLYKSKNFAQINFGQYINNTARQLLKSYDMDSERVSLYIRAADVMLSIDTAIPCGLIINELITNSLKYAFPEGRKGGIKIMMSRFENGIKILFEDDGAGIPENVNFRSKETFGLDLVNLLVEQLDGDIKLFRDSGTKYEITVKTETLSEPRSCRTPK